MTAVERARQALAHIEAAWEDDDAPLPSDFQAIRDLLAEIDAGVWLDTREMVALGSGDDPDVALYYEPGGINGKPWCMTWRMSGVVYGATAVDAVRAAREAADA